MGASWGHTCTDGSLRTAGINKIFLHKSGFTGRKGLCEHCSILERNGIHLNPSSTQIKTANVAPVIISINKPLPQLFVSSNNQ